MSQEFAATPWSGRFEQVPSAELQEYGASLPVDKFMWREDLAGSRAHAQMLAAAQIISQEDLAALEAAFEKVTQEIEAGSFVFDVADEDIHMALEKRITQIAGDAGKRLHTGRSRNDQVATDGRLLAKRFIQEMSAAAVACMDALLEQANKHYGLIMPGYTHLQRAQPVLVSHHLLAYFWMLSRDLKRLRHAHEAADINPLGSAALAGTSYPLDRQMTTELLGFAMPSCNSLDAVSDRDFMADLIYAASMIQIHLSRLCEEIILWSSAEFGFITLSDAYSTGSSIMPQKKNPDFAELTRGKSGRVVGDLTGFLVMLKGLPLAYNKDMQEDKEFLIDACSTATQGLRVCAGMIATLRFNEERLQEASLGGFMAATDVADVLTSQGMPFREAHEVVGSLVLAAEKSGRSLQDFSLEELQAHNAAFNDEVLEVLKIENVVARRSSFGGTSQAQVKEQLILAENQLRTERSFLEDLW